MGLGVLGWVVVDGWLDQVGIRLSQLSTKLKLKLKMKLSLAILIVKTCKNFVSSCNLFKLVSTC